LPNYVLSLSGSPHDSVRGAGQGQVRRLRGLPRYGRQGQPGPGRPNLTDDIWLHGFGEAAIVAMINNGKVNEMPAQADKLTDAQINVLTAYVWGLSNKAGRGQVMVSSIIQA
jgi:cytochrome c oxidase cbb3-type subunit 3